MNTKNRLDDLTIGEARELARMFGCQPAATVSPSVARWVGSIVLVRTVTFYYVGIMESADPHGLVLREAAWVPNTGRFSAALESGQPAEVEPYPGEGYCTVGLGGIIDIGPWKQTLRVVK